MLVDAPGTSRPPSSWHPAPHDKCLPIYKYGLSFSEEPGWTETDPLARESASGLPHTSYLHIGTQPKHHIRTVEGAGEKAEERSSVTAEQRCESRMPAPTHSFIGIRHAPPLVLAWICGSARQGGVVGTEMVGVSKRSQKYFLSGPVRTRVAKAGATTSLDYKSRERAEKSPINFYVEIPRPCS